MFVSTARIRGFLRIANAVDVALLRQVHRCARPWVAGIFHGVCSFADAIAWPLHAAVVLWISAFEPGPCLAIVFGTILATLMSQPLKRAIRRPRPRTSLPDIQPRYDDPDTMSLPSGHAAASVAAAVALSLINAPMAGAYLGFAAVVGLGRVVLGAHYPGDVLAGALLGALAGSAAATLVAVL